MLQMQIIVKKLQIKTLYKDKEREITSRIISDNYSNYESDNNIEKKQEFVEVKLKKKESTKSQSNKFFDQLITTGLSNDEKINYKKFTKEYEDYKNLYNIRNHQNITEIRDVINRYGENAKIHLGGIPMIADDMMS